MEPRRSSRSNKGRHASRDDYDLYYQMDEEPQIKKQKLSQSHQDSDEEFDPSKEPADNADTSINGGSDEGDVLCDPCGTNKTNYDEDTDRGGIMIECDDCKTWQHAKCMGFRNQKTIPSNYQCNRCEPKEAEEEKPSSKVKKSVSAKAEPRKDKTRVSVVKAFVNVMSKTNAVPIGQTEEFANNLENAVYEWSGSVTNKKYIDKSRSVMALAKKEQVISKLVNQSLTFTDVVSKQPEEIDRDLKEYAEKVRQESIRRSVLTVDDPLSQRIRRTHKGEEIVETASSNPETYEMSVVSKSIDHRNFKEDSPQPAESIKKDNVVPASNLYNLDDDDDDQHYEPLNENNDDQGESDGEKAGLSDDELDFILKGPEKPKQEPEPQVKKEATPNLPPKPRSPSVPPTMATSVWKGEVIFPDFAAFVAEGEFLSCTNYVKPKDNVTASFHNRAIRVSKELLERPKYLIEGRLDRHRADPYLEKIVTSRDLYVVQLHCEANSPDYNKLFDYLLTRSKVGVLSDKAPCVKDAYVLALRSDNIPGYLRFAGLENKEGLFAVYVVKKDYVPVGKSILKKTPAPVSVPQPAPQPPQTANLDSILSKLGGSLLSLQTQQQAPNPQTFYPPNQNQQPMPLELNQDQLQYLSELVNQNPQVQQNPQALMSLLQQGGPNPLYS